MPTGLLAGRLARLLARGLTDERVDGQVGGQVGGRAAGHVGGQTHRWMDGQMDRRTDRPTDRRGRRCACTCICMQTARTHRRMPFIIGWSWFENATLESRANVNGGFSHGVVVYLDGKADLEAYLPHTEHMKVKEAQAHLLESSLVVDLTEQIPEDCAELDLSMYL